MWENAGRTTAVGNILSIDVESWVHFYDSALRLNRKLTGADRKSLDKNYIPVAVKNMLKLLERHKQKATFFVVAELYDWYPEAIEDIVSRGHEIGYHTHTHKTAYSKEILESELEQSARFLARFHPAGFRAPNIYLTRPSMPLLARYGFTYSSSTYGAYAIQRYDGIAEVPVSAMPLFWSRAKREQRLPRHLTIQMLGDQIPFGSGLFIAPLGTHISYFIERFNKKGTPAVIFIHPWQLYQTREIRGLSFIARLIWRNPLCLPYAINSLRSFEKLLQNHTFTSFREYYGQQTLLEP